MARAGSPYFFGFTVDLVWNQTSSMHHLFKEGVEGRFSFAHQGSNVFNFYYTLEASLKDKNPDRQVECEKKDPCKKCEGKWEETKSCTKTCGPEKRTLTYKVTQTPTDGSICQITDGSEKQEDCNHPECVSCTGIWEIEGECDQPCGTKELTQRYSITKGNDGSSCDFPEGAKEVYTCPEIVKCEECTGEYVPCLLYTSDAADE